MSINILSDKSKDFIKNIRSNSVAAATPTKNEFFDIQNSYIEAPKSPFRKGIKTIDAETRFETSGASSILK